MHLSATDIGGGAAIATFRIHRGLRHIGVDSSMVVGNKLSDEDKVTVVRETRTNLEWMRHRFRSMLIQRQFARYRSTLSPLYYFSDDRAPRSNLIPSKQPPTDVYHLHWVAEFLNYRSFFRWLPSDIPVVWTLHDMNPFTGGCHYTAGCDKFVGNCGVCPALGSTSKADLSTAIFRRKQSAYSRVNPELMRIVTPSVWLAREASRSALFRKFQVSTIPYGLDTETFRPQRRFIAREAFGVPQQLKVIMFAAQSLHDHRKGMDLLLAALDGLDDHQQIGLISMGKGPLLPEQARFQYFPFGELTTERLMSLAYSAADLFILPTREDNLPNVVLEALACGTPVIAFDVGGLPDIVRPGVTGLLVPPENVRALREAIGALVTDDERRSQMSHECRRAAVAEYGLDLQAKRYRQVYEALLDQTQKGAAHI
jgi:glycosyltransferase involved in cell wall biosynthesis